jgi:hypothetical protein
MNHLRSVCSTTATGVRLAACATHLDVLGCGGVEDLVNACPVAGTHAHWARLAAGVQHAAPAVDWSNSSSSSKVSKDTSKAVFVRSGAPGVVRLLVLIIR